MLECEVCGRKYRSSAWLHRHVESEHGGTPQREGVRRGSESIGAEAGTSSGAQAAEGRPVSLVEHGVKPLTTACLELGIDEGEILSFRVYEDRVVIIEGPAGRKRVWRRRE